MRKGDILWGLSLVNIILFIVSPWTNPLFVVFTASRPYVSGFMKFMILASMGELLSNRIKAGKWIKPLGIGYHALVWGAFGVLITLFFKIYSTGILSCMQKGYLPGYGSNIAFAIQTSILNNIFFAPIFMAIHRFTDTYIDYKLSEKDEELSIDELLRKVDWNHFTNFILFKTIPFFWIPAHTITFLLPGEYRIIVAAMYSIVLGALLSIKSNSTSSDNIE